MFGVLIIIFLLILAVLFGTVYFFGKTDGLSKPFKIEKLKDTKIFLSLVVLLIFLAQICLLFPFALAYGKLAQFVIIQSLIFVFISGLGFWHARQNSMIIKSDN